VYYTKSAGATTTSPIPANGRVVQTAYPPSSAMKPVASGAPAFSPQPAVPPSQVAAPNPRTPAATMPVLDPTQFRKAAADWN
jgi:hypothetical protein